MALMFKALIGAAVVVLIALLSKSKHYFIAGLVPLFPSFALIAHYLVGTDRGPTALKTTLLFGMWSLLPYAAYLLAVYLLLDHWGLSGALLGAVMVWVLAAGLLIVLWSWFT
jgi:membrane protein GlpM